METDYPYIIRYDGHDKGMESGMEKGHKMGFDKGQKEACAGNYYAGNRLDEHWMHVGKGEKEEKSKGEKESVHHMSINIGKGEKEEKSKGEKKEKKEKKTKEEK